MILRLSKSVSSSSERFVPSCDGKVQPQRKTQMDGTNGNSVSGEVCGSADAVF